MRSVLFLFVMIVMGACHTVSTRKVPDSAPHTIYKSLGNDVADISLRLYPGHTMEIEMMSFGPTSEDARSRVFGKWKNEDGRFILTFSRGKINIREMFDSSDVEGIDYTFENDRTVAFGSELTTIFLWGIACEKIKGGG